MIFSLFGKKDRRPDTSADKSSAPSKGSALEATQRTDSGKSSNRSASKRDPQAALATALKIDAIESEMSSEFKITSTTRPSAPSSPTASASAAAQQPKKPAAASEKPTPFAPVSSSSMGDTTEFLLNSSSTLNTAPVAVSESAPITEEAAIMFANGQTALAEQMLQSAIAEDLAGDTSRETWLMLFDLYQVTRKHQEFEVLSLAYANKFETSPPTWSDSGQQEMATSASTSPGSRPLVSFSGKLDTQIGKNIERIQKLAETHRTLRLEFVRITEVEATGCALLLDLLKKLQKTGHDLVLAGAPELAEKIRAIIEAGRRDDTEDAWLLLLEILRLLNQEKEFEEASIDYCVTFEVSPPAFMAPQNKVTTATAEATPAASPEEGFMMPAVVEGRIDDLILSIAAYSDENNPAVINCSRLNRVDFNAAGRLLTGLAPFCINGKTIEFHHVNHLVAALFNVIGLKDIARILPRKN